MQEQQLLYRKCLKTILFTNDSNAFGREHF